MFRSPGGLATTAGLSILLLWASAITDGQILSQDIDAAELRMAALTDWHVRLTNKLDDIEKETESASYAIRRLDKRMDRLLDMTGGCKVGFFPCSAGPVGSVQCIRDYLVCDGSADCKNGADEDKERCVDPFKDGPNLWIATVKDTCLGTIPGNPHGGHFYPSETLPWFPSRPTLSWIYYFPDFYMDGMMSAAFYADGFYDFATGDLTFAWVPEGHKLIGRAWLDPISADRSRFMCDMHRPHHPKELNCLTAVAVLQK